MKNNELVLLLIEKNLHIAFAESLTGGMLASKIVEVAYASKILNESYVTYSNESKCRVLGVIPNTIDKFDVVSEEVAKEMVIGLKVKTNSDICVSVTGIAGPTGGTKENPIGTVCFGFIIGESIVTKKVCFGNLGRNIVREKTCDYVFDYLINELRGI